MQSEKKQRIAVIGAGSWGTALAKSLVDSGHEVRLWARRPEVACRIEEERENPFYLPGIKLGPSLRAVSHLEEALEGAQAVLSVVPTHALREVLSQAAPLFPKEAVVISATKGIENHTLKLISEIFEEYLEGKQRENKAFLGGPSFAKEVALGMPTAVVVASRNPETAQKAQKLLGSERMRVYTTEDVTGIEIGGALKNVMAIAAGIADGLGFGHNTRAAIITRGLAEIGRLAMKKGGHPLTLAGLGGVGDLVLTCTGDLSRNRRVGIELGKGRKIGEIISELSQVAEGVGTAQSAYHLAQREGVEMPIVEMVYRVIYEGFSPREAVVALMSRPFRAERD
ncbi:MAG: NAD(P)-dependent glycerol-3-phosphate dehydrogenase [Sandaracinaceae bacterium]|nr:NAD(P)-dependent glycerol-3-phosphate dehydrogenase [Sandaracinaceae bacterium]